MRNLHQLFVLCTASQIIGGDFAKFCGLLRIYELYREVVLGELRIDTDPDCTNNGRSCAPRKITREIKTDDQIIVHENYQPGSQTQANDIALIRLNEPVPLYDDDPKRYIKG